MSSREVLPESSAVDVGILSRLFNDCVTSYKYFFFLSLLDRISGEASDRAPPIGEAPTPSAIWPWTWSWPHGIPTGSAGYPWDSRICFSPQLTGYFRISLSGGPG